MEMTCDICKLSGYDKGSLEWCEFWKPPPDPPANVLSVQSLLDFRNELPETIEAAWMDYRNACNIAEPETSASTDPDKDKVTVIIVVVVLLLFFLALVAILMFLLYRKKLQLPCIPWRRDLTHRDLPECLAMVTKCCPFFSRTDQSLNNSALPMEKYSSVNYLDNKAKKGDHWNQNKVGNSGAPEPVQDEDRPRAKANDYQIGTPPAVTTHGRPRKSFEKLHISTSHDELLAQYGRKSYDNETFEHNEGGLDVSPGTNSNTPLFDDTDSVLPNQVLPPIKSLQANSLGSAEDVATSHDYPVEQSEKTPSTRKLPPVLLNEEIQERHQEKKRRKKSRKRSSEPVKAELSLTEAAETNNNRRSV